MNDRQPTPGMEGRVLVTPEDGSAPFYAKIEMADQPVAAGTPLNTVTFWPAAVAALFGLPGTSLPADGFEFLGNLNLHHWRRQPASWATELIGPYNYNIYAGSYPDSNASTYYYSESISVDGNGNIQLVNPQSVTATYNTYTNLSVLAGKYYYRDDGSSSGFQNNQLVYSPADAAPGQATGGSWYYVTMAAYDVVAVLNQTGEAEYVLSQNRDAYPDYALQNGNLYTYLGVPYQNAMFSVKVIYGEYIGTGEGGAAHPTSISALGRILYARIFPQYAQVESVPDNYRNTETFFGLSESYTAGRGFGSTASGNTLYCKTNADGSEWSWYSDGSGSQYNSLDIRYQYFILYI